MKDVSRRSFLVQGSAAATGVAAVGMYGIPKAGAADGATQPELSDEEVLAAAGPLVVHISDVASGKVEILVADQSVVFTDKQLVAKVLRRSRGAEPDMSSHREAPAISKDPVADNTDTYAFVSPGRHGHDDHQLPAAADAGRGTELLRVRRRRRSTRSTSTTTATGSADVTYQFQFTTEIRNPDTFLYNTGPITSLDSPNWNRRQTYTSRDRPKARRTAHDEGPRRTGLAVPAVQHRPSLDTELRRARRRGHRHAATRRARCSPASGPTPSSSTSARSSTWARCDRSRSLHLIPTAECGRGRHAAGVNVHTIAIQVPIADLTVDGIGPHRPDVAGLRCIGVWGAASRRKATGA